MTQKSQEELPDFQTSPLLLMEIIYLTKDKNIQYEFTKAIQSFKIKLMKIKHSLENIYFIHSEFKRNNLKASQLSVQFFHSSQRYKWEKLGDSLSNFTNIGKSWI